MSTYADFTLRLIFLLLFLYNSSEGSIRRFPSAGTATLKQAILLCKPYDTLLISGSHREGEIQITVPLYVKGENNAELIGDKKCELLTINSGNVTVENITFSHSGINNNHDNAAIKITDAEHCRIENNIFLENHFGVYFANSKNSIVTRNEFRCTGLKETNSGNAVHLWKSSSITVSHNYITGHRDAIYLEFATNIFVNNNECTGNTRYGLHFMFSSYCSYINNLFEGNVAGAAVMYSNNVYMRHNTFSKSLGPSSYGLLLKEIYDSRLTGNIFSDNSVAVFSESTTRVLADSNIFRGNGFAVRIMSSSQNCTFRDNVFTGNSFDVTTNSIHNTNSFTHNFWSSYSGYDLNRDGIGDIPYHPVTLFAVLVEKNPPLILLMKSPVARLLDLAEKIMPSFTPETLVDSTPLLRGELQESGYRKLR